MRVGIFLGLALAGCSATVTEADRLMDRIEASVPLPEGAKQLDQYGRYYTYSEPGKVLAIYTVPSQSLPAGERRWLDGVDAIPQILDGGCTQVTIEYVIATDQFAFVKCNGLA